MLKDEDFDEIGKRLHDLEAAPPEDGWNRISGAIIPPPPGSPGKRGFVSRNWWKPLVLLIPVVLYFSVPRNQDNTLAQNEGIDSLTQNNNQGKTERENKKDISSESENIKTEDQYKSTLPNNNTKVDDAYTEIKTESLPGETARLKKPSADGMVNNKRSSRPDNDQPTNTVNQDENGTKNEIDPEKNKTKLATIIQTSEIIRSPSVVSNSIEEEVAYRKDTLTTNPNKNVTRTGNGLREISVVPHETSVSEKEGYTIPKNETTAQVLLPARESVTPDSSTSKSISQDKNENLVITTEENDVASPKRNKLKYVSNPGMAEGTPGKEISPVQFIADSLKNTGMEKATDSIRIPSLDKERETGLWRITATFSPHYMFKTIRPDQKDEVLVTNINPKNSRYPERIGYGFAAGAGKEIRKNFYIDGQLNYYTLTQNLSYSYATGNIDTLLQERRADGNVYAIPVYQTVDSEINSRFNYGGLRLGTTYYFWANQRRRFNVSVFGGMNYRLSASIRERVNERWYDRPVQNLNRVNYSVMFSGGYNIRLKGNWELMLNPMITYYSKNGNTSLQRISLRQKSYGINVMISKSIGRK